MTWTTQFSDAFTGTDGTSLSTHDATWVKRTTIAATIQTNRGSAPATAGSGQVRYSVNKTLANDQAMQLDFVSPYNFSVGVRHAHVGAEDAFTGYFVQYNGATSAAQLYSQYPSGTFNLLASTTPGAATGAWRIEAVGTALTTYRAGSTTNMPAATDGNIASGQAFFRAATTTSTFDNALVEDAATSLPWKLLLLGVG